MQSPAGSAFKQRLVQLMPNMLTVAALCAGLSSIRFAIDDNLKLAAILIICAAVLDVLDGGLARLLGTESDIGAELDSFSDAISFGVAPAILMYLWIVDSVPQVGWIAALFYAASCVFRLARFNQSSRAADAPVTNKYFTGVPAPAGAMLLLLPLFVSFMLPMAGVLPPVFAAVWLVIVGLLMIGRFRTPSLKSNTIFANHRRLCLILGIMLAVALAAYSWLAIVFITSAYIVVLIFGWGRDLRAKTKGKSD